MKKRISHAKQRIELHGRRAYARVKKVDWRWAGLIVLALLAIISLVYEMRH